MRSVSLHSGSAGHRPFCRGFTLVPDSQEQSLKFGGTAQSFRKVQNWAGTLAVAACALLATSAGAQDHTPSKADIIAGYSFLHPGGSIGGVAIDAFSSAPGFSGFNANATYFFNRYVGGSFDYAIFSCHCKIDTYQAGLVYSLCPCHERITPLSSG